MTSRRSSAANRARRRGPHARPDAGSGSSLNVPADRRHARAPRELGVREVWIWEDRALTFHVLRGKTYAKKARSGLPPALDPALIGRCVGARTQTEAVRLLRQALRRRPRGRSRG